MGSTRQKLVDLLWHGVDPVAGFRVDPSKVDHHGWNSHHFYLNRSVDETKPRIVVEIGVWKGESVLTLAERLRHNGLDSVVLAVDTWLGSSEHFTDPEFQKSIFGSDGSSRLYQCFMNNVFDRGLQDFILPIPLDSINAYNVLKKLNIFPDVLHIDAGHDFESATNDLVAWWPLLNSSGALIGDDYFADGSLWPEVKKAFDAFFSRVNVPVFESIDAKCYIRKQ